MLGLGSGRYPKSEVKVLGASEDVFKRSLEAPDSWETPRAPFEVITSPPKRLGPVLRPHTSKNLPLQVEVICSARCPSSDGSQGTGTPYFQTPEGQPLAFTIGDGTVRPLLLVPINK